VFRLVLDTVIDAANVVGRVQPLPGARFIGMDDLSDVFAYQRHCLALPRHNERPGAAPHFAGDNHDLALASMFLSEATVFAIAFPIRRFGVTARILPST
jgi:hypothetical protein